MKRWAEKSKTIFPVHENWFFLIFGPLISDLQSDFQNYLSFDIFSNNIWSNHNFNRNNIEWQIIVKQHFSAGENRITTFYQPDNYTNAYLNKWWCFDKKYLAYLYWMNCSEVLLHHWWMQNQCSLTFFFQKKVRRKMLQERKFFFAHEITRPNMCGTV